MLDCLVLFLILWVALMPDRLGYDEVGEGGGPGAASQQGLLLLLHQHHLSQKLE
jgi:hypothetical protein